MGCWLEAALCSWLWGPLQKAAHNMAASSQKKKQEEPERGRVSKTEITIFYNLISEMTSYLFAAFCSLETSHWVQSALEGRELHKSMKARRQGSLEGILEASCQWVYLLLKLAYPNFPVSLMEQCSALVSVRVLNIIWTFYPMHSAYSWEQKQKCPISGSS